MTDQRWAIDIDRDTIADARIVEEPQADLPEGAIEVKLDLYAMTANNVTYAVFGKPLGLFGNDQGYWDFFAEREAPGAAAGLGLCHGEPQQPSRRAGGDAILRLLSDGEPMRCCIRAG